MGIFSEMFGDKPDHPDAPKKPETLAAGEFVYDGADVLAGYKVFRRRYVVKRTVLFLLLSLLALASSIMMLMSDGASMFPLMCVAISAMVTIWFIKTPFENAAKTKKAVAELEGERYGAEITTAAVKITLLSPAESYIDETLEVDQEITPLRETTEPENETSGRTEFSEDEAYSQDPASTLIHLDQYIVDMIDTGDSYVIVVAKKYVFVIPQSAFTKDENEKVAARLSDVMDERFKSVKKSRAGD
jgi:hypothetical protein